MVSEKMKPLRGHHRGLGEYNIIQYNMLHQSMAAKGWIKYSTIQT